MNTYLQRREGIGSMFHRIDTMEHPLNLVEIAFKYELFYTGRQAFKYIIDDIASKQTIEKIWMPNYYCQYVTRWVKKIYSNLYFYDINPFEFNSPLNVNSFATDKDVVLINNFWGLSDFEPKAANGPIIVEDHSHGWLTKNCMHSKADYCFASLRKSLPIPLGGICWKPTSEMNIDNNRFSENTEFYEVFDRQYEAMNDKNRYRNGASSIEKNNYLKIMNETEDFLDKNYEIIKLKPTHTDLLEKYVTSNYLEIKETNLKTLYNNIINTNFMKVLKRKDYTTFGLTLLFKEEAYWKSLRAHLIEHAIYPSYLWPDNKLNFDWNYILNVHVDFRYNKNDMIFISEKINEWIKITN